MPILAILFDVYTYYHHSTIVKIFPVAGGEMFGVVVTEVAAEAVHTHRINNA